MEIKSLDSHTFALSGELDLANINEVINAVTQSPLPVGAELTLELYEMEITSTLALIAFANLVSALSKRINGVNLDGAPGALVDHLKEAQSRRKISGVSFLNTRELEAAE